MAYLSPEFQHDVFISYAHGDFDRAGTSDLKEWSLTFAGKFEAELRESLSSGSPRIFIDDGKKHDQRLDRSDPLVKQLRQKASGAAFLLILMSPLYLRSDWCRDELTWWFDATRAQAFPEVRSRHFVARIRPIKDDSWPAQLRDEGQPLGYWFHERPGDEFNTRPFGWSSRTDGELKDAIVVLAGDIARRMTELNQALQRKRQAEANIAKLRDDGGQLIYVHGRERDRARWQAACDELRRAGYTVFPHAPQTEYDDPRLAIGAEMDSIRMLSGCDGLLLVPSDDPWSLQADLVAVGHRWRNSARRFARKLLPCAVVDRGSTLDAKSLWKGKARTLGIQWIDAAIADWIGEVRGWLSAAGAGQSAA